MPTLKTLSLALLCGIAAGLSSAVFLALLELATTYRQNNQQVILLLPIVGLFIVWTYQRFGKRASLGNTLVVSELRDSKKTLPWQMAPLVFLGTILTHLFGGSAGRESSAVQMGASLSDQASRFFSLSVKERKILLSCGAGAGFGAAIGTPVAGAIFAMEFQRSNGAPLYAPFEAFVSSFTGFFIVLLLQAPHSHYPSVIVPALSVTSFFYVIISALFFAGITRLFFLLLKYQTHLLKKLARSDYWRAFVGGSLLVLFFWLEGSYRFTGLGIGVIQEALNSTSSLTDSIYKTLFTSLTLASGFKGGEFTPLVFIGSTLGSSLSNFIPLSFSFLGALGFVSVYAAAAKVPLSCTIMAIEFFGPEIALYALVCCFISSVLAGGRGLYSGASR